MKAATDSITTGSGAAMPSPVRAIANRRALCTGNKQDRPRLFPNQVFVHHPVISRDVIL